MPNADHYRTGAARFRAVAQFADDHAMALVSRHDADTFATGPLANAVHDQIGSAARHLHDARWGLLDLAALCDRRAALCEQALLEREAWWGVVADGFEGTPRVLARYQWLELPDASDTL